MNKKNMAIKMVLAAVGAVCSIAAQAYGEKDDDKPAEKADDKA